MSRGVARQGNMAGTGRTGPETKLTQAAKHFYLRKVRSYTTVVLTAFEENRGLHCRLSVSLPWSKVRRAFCPQPPRPYFPFSVF